MNIPINVVTAEQINDYHQMLLNNAFIQKLEHNEKQFTIWNEYKNRHKKIIAGLQVYPLSLSENCMVPIGKRALMKGKLIHTNEVLVCLGCGYFAKYSASQAIALCNRRIAYADEILKNLEIERDFYEMKQILPSNYDIFENEDRKNIQEYWSDDEYNKWQIQHKQRKKEYHQKLAKLKEKEKFDIHIEEDLFKRLDELELKEELEDEIYRLKIEEEQFYDGDDDDDDDADDDDLENDEVYVESDNISDSNEIITEIIEELKEQTLTPNSNMIQNEVLDTNLDSKIKTEQSDLIMNSDQVVSRINSLPEFKNNTESTRTKRVSFIEPCIMENKDNMEEKTITSQRICPMSQDNTHNEDSEDENNRIEFSHSSYIPDIIESTTEIKSPEDIYKIFDVPKSILKRSPNDMIPNQISSLLCEEDSIETEDENDINYSIYNSVIKENVQERQDKTSIDSTSKKTDNKIISKFKLSTKFIQARRNNV